MAASWSRRGRGCSSPPPAAEEADGGDAEQARTLIGALNLLSRNLPLPPAVLRAVSSIYRGGDDDEDEEEGGDEEEDVVGDTSPTFKTEEITKWGHEAAEGWPARPAPAAPTYPWALVWPLALTLRLLKASVAKPPTRATIRKTFETPPRIPSRGFWRSPPAPCRRGFISGGLYTAMVASGVMSE
ncbi:hypothetical protein QYE76_009477 [Lolium multiflorum]|uniref:Uncharacterized protein n=1 Tax=Lolium multiflorum TaxID=4521 RepID=A0AAD8X238_LOLMU|nr:hypothetical protein QYE76_009477 [Lolium multiflorum]